MKNITQLYRFKNEFLCNMLNDRDDMEYYGLIVRACGKSEVVGGCEVFCNCSVNEYYVVSYRCYFEFSVLPIEVREYIMVNEIK